MYVMDPWYVCAVRLMPQREHVKPACLVVFIVTHE